MRLHDLERHAEERREQRVGQVDDETAARQIDQAERAHPDDAHVLDVEVEVLENELHEVQVDLFHLDRLPE